MASILDFMLDHVKEAGAASQFGMVGGSAESCRFCQQWAVLPARSDHIISSLSCVDLVSQSQGRFTWRFVYVFPNQMGALALIWG